MGHQVGHIVYLSLLSFVDEQRLRDGAALLIGLYSSPTLTWPQAYDVLNHLENDEVVEVSLIKPKAGRITPNLIQNLQTIGWSVEEVSFIVQQVQ